MPSIERRIVWELTYLDECAFIVYGRYITTQVCNVLVFVLISKESIMNILSEHSPPRPLLYAYTTESTIHPAPGHKRRRSAHISCLMAPLCQPPVPLVAPGAHQQRSRILITHISFG